MAGRGIGTDPSQRMKRQKLKLRRPADLLTVVGGAIPSLLNRPNSFSLHILDKCTIDSRGSERMYHACILSWPLCLEISALTSQTTSRSFLAFSKLCAFSSRVTVYWPDGVAPGILR